MEAIKQLKLNKTTILIIGIIGLILMFFSGAKNEPVYDSEEDRLAHILSNIEGAGEVKVMLSAGEEPSSMFAEKKGSEYIGAVILAEGGEKSSVRAKIIKAVEAVTGLEAHRIIVYRLGS